MAGWWVIYYGDGTRFTNEDGTPWDAPRVDAQAVAQGDSRCGYRLIGGHDYIYWEPERGGWGTTDGFGLWDHMVRCKHPLVLFGRQMDDASWHSLWMRIRSELGDKQGWLMTEPRPNEDGQ